jgi:hypothetical protein
MPPPLGIGWPSGTTRGLAGASVRTRASRGRSEPEQAQASSAAAINPKQTTERGRNGKRMT